MAMPEQPLRTVGIYGAGVVGLSAAIAFARALPQARVGIIDSPRDPAALADRLPGTLPSLTRFHEAIGIGEGDLVRSGIATHRLGCKFENWSPDGLPWYHVFGEYGVPTGGAAFHHLWARARRAGRALAYHRYSTAAALAEAGRFVYPEQDPMSALSTYGYGLRLDPERYRDHLLAKSHKLPLLRAQGEVGGVERREDGGIAALILKDGRRLEADLFIDCGGPTAPLHSQLTDAFEDWGESLPCDRLLFGSHAAPAGPSSCDTAAATANGWRWQAPLRDRLLSGAAYSSDFGGDEMAAELGLATAEVVAIRPGRRPEPWKTNVLALGDAAVAVDPLQSTNLHLAQSAILRVLELLPGRDCHPLELREYNRRTNAETMRVRDFLALHYLRSPRKQGPFWRSMAARRVPESLAHTLEQFEARGRLPFYEEESFDSQSWLAVLFGLGVLPRDTDPLAAKVDPEESAAAMKRLSDGIAAIPGRLPDYGAYLERIMSGPIRR